MNTKNLKPFDLQAALRGEPVMLRDGSKAFVRHHETEITILGNFTLMGVKEDHPFHLSWTPEGEVYEDYSYEDYGNELNIIGMYSKSRIINGFEVPVPETDVLGLGSKYFIASNIHKNFFNTSTWYDYEFDKLNLERGLVFLNKEDAIANAKAMLGINPYEEEEE